MWAVEQWEQRINTFFVRLHFSSAFEKCFFYCKTGRTKVLFRIIKCFINKCDKRLWFFLSGHIFLHVFNKVDDAYTTWCLYHKYNTELQEAKSLVTQSGISIIAKNNQHLHMSQSDIDARVPNVLVWAIRLNFIEKDHLVFHHFTFVTFGPPCR